MRYFLRFACEQGAITSDQAEAYLDRCKAAFKEIADADRDDNNESKPSEQWRRLIVTALSSKRAHLVNKEGKNPGAQYGWTTSVRKLSDGTEEEMERGGGPQIGWIKDDDIYLLPGAAYKVACTLGSQSGDHITTSEKMLNKFLYQDGMLATTSLKGSRNTYTIRERGLQGERPEVLHIKKSLLFAEQEDIPTNLVDPVDPVDPASSDTAPQANSEATKGGSSTEGGSSSFVDPSLEELVHTAKELLEDTKAYFMERRKKGFHLPVLYRDRDNSKGEQLGSHSYIARVNDEICSGDPQRIKLATDAMLRTLERYED